MASLSEVKLVSTGDPDLDSSIAIGFLLFATVCVYDVAGIFWTAYKNATRTAGGRRRALLRKREICLFLVLAVVALFIVNGIKFEYQMLKLATWDEIKAEFGQVKGPVDFKKGSRLAKKTLREMTNFVPVRYTYPDENLEHSRQHIKQAVKKASEYLSRGEALTAKLHHELTALYRTVVCEKGRNNIWDLFKTIVIRDQRFWWTQQWFTGYMAWAVFVAIECHHRDIRSSAVLSFTALGYILNLSGVQCLFYVLLLLKPKIARRSTWMPLPTYTLIAFGSETLSLFLLAKAVHSPVNSEHGWIFSVLQATVIVIPPLSQRCVAPWPHSYMRHRGTTRMAKRSLYFTYFIMSVPMAGALHILVTDRAIDEAGCGKGILWLIGVPWNNRPEPKTIREFTSTVRALINALGDHDWISAVGADVLLSAVALSCWAVEMVGKVASRAQEAAEGDYNGVAEQVRDGLSSAKGKARQEKQGLKRRTSQWREDIGLEEDENEDEDEELDSDVRQLLEARRGRPRKAPTRERREMLADYSRSHSKSRVGGSPVKGDASRRRSRTRERSRSRASVRRGSENDDEESQILTSTAKAMAAPAEAAGVA